MIYWDIFESPVGELYIAEEEGSITLIGYRRSADIYLKKAGVKGFEQTEGRGTAVIETAVNQLEEYFSGIRKEFTLPLAPRGTEFQLKVWKSLCEIPYGETRSYKDIAEAVGCPKGYRAVGMANNRNPVMIVIPCHRVIGSGGSLTGYAGGLERKQWLLDWERDKV